uniref:RNA-directed DNA polymerase n=1 Tax=Ixodes scapularis TaxID=6945 RepID=A0A1S4M1F1_IXOSC
MQLEKRQKVLEMGQDFMWAGHFGEQKTKVRVKTLFYSPGIAGDIQNHFQSCRECHLRAPIRAADRVPIAPLARPEVPFQTVFLDCIGPLEPPSSRGHKYALCVVDTCTRWPEVVCLKSLTARAACDVLVEVFSRMGVPETVCSDQGSNFTAQLTGILLEKMGATPRFSTSDHPQSNGLVERWNGTFKKMLHHVVHEKGREWDKHTTGRSPFELMYGREPVGPLSILAK